METTKNVLKILSLSINCKTGMFHVSSNATVYFYDNSNKVVANLPLKAASMSKRSNYAIDMCISSFLDFGKYLDSVNLRDKKGNYILSDKIDSFDISSLSESDQIELKHLKQTI